VIAADEGVMPQTREHLAIIDLLGIQHGVIALTKSDLVEPDFLELAASEVRTAVQGTTLASAPIIHCSGITRSGLEGLVEALDVKLSDTPVRVDMRRPRLPIDRVFTMPGFGTVVTGTLIEGSLKVGDEVEIVPGGLKSRVRGLQSHGRKVDIATPGRRTAVNLAGVAVENLHRGMVVAAPGAVRPTSAIDVRLRAVSHLPRPVRHDLEVTFHTGSSETDGRLLLLDAESLEPGQSGWAQVRLAEPIAALKGDHFIIRDPNDTLGGGRIVDTQVRRHRRIHAPTLAALDLLFQGAPEEALLSAVSSSEPVTLEIASRRAGMESAEAREAAQILIGEGRLVSLEDGAMGNQHLITVTGLAALTSSAQDVLGAYHKNARLRRGMPREELRSRLKLSSRAFDLIVSLWVERDEIRESKSALALPSHQPTPHPAQLSRARAYLEALEANPYAPTPTDPLEEAVLSYLEDSGQIVRVDDSVAFSTRAYEEMKNRIVDRLRDSGTVTLAEVRDMFGTSRKYAQALLEYLDGEHVTRRTGDTRVLYKPA
jgi:selenocysteine-specific elongation factor